MITLTPFFASIVATLTMVSVLLPAININMQKATAAAFVIGSVVGPQIASGIIGFAGRTIEERYNFDGLNDRTTLDKAMHKFYNSFMVAALSVGSFYLAQPYVPEYVAAASGMMSAYWYACGRLSCMYGESDKVSELYMKFRYMPVYATAIITMGLFPQFARYAYPIRTLSMIGSAFTLSSLQE